MPKTGISSSVAALRKENLIPSLPKLSLPKNHLGLLLVQNSVVPPCKP